MTNANTIVNGRYARKMINGSGSIRLLYTNFTKSTTSEDIPPNAIHVKSAIEYPIGNITPITFNGRQVATIEPGSSVWSDPIGINAPPGATVYERVTASPPMPPVVSILGSTNGGNIPSGTYYYKVTCVTDGCESNASAEVSVTNTGTTSNNAITIGNENFKGVKVLYYNIYRSTTTGGEIYIGSINGGARLYTDNGTIAIVSTTLSAAASATRTLSLTSTAGMKAGDLVTITGLGDYTINNVASPTSVIIATAASITAASGTVVTLKSIPPTASYALYNNILTYTIDSNEGTRNGNDMAYANNSFTYSVANGNGYAAAAIIGYPAKSAVTPKPAIALIGNSIMNGKGYCSTIADYAGFGGLALNDQFPYVNLSAAGELARDFATLQFSKTRMSILQSCKYAICEYGRNDLSLSLSAMKANCITIAQRSIDAGIAFFWETTLIPIATSTDGGQTYANQTPGTTQEITRQAFNKWLRAPISAGAGNSFLYDVGTGYVAYIGVFDTGATLEKNSSGTAITISGTDGSISNGNGGYWPIDTTATHYTNNIGTISGTTSTLTDAGQSFSVNQYAGYCVAITTGATTVYKEISSNTATVLTFSGTTTAPTSASTYFIYKGYFIPDDFTHPTDAGHVLMAGAINTALFN